MKPTTLQCTADTDFTPFLQTRGPSWLCDTTFCSRPAEWQRTVRGVALLACTPCKQRMDEREER
jgi:hypothetical protein